MAKSTDKPLPMYKINIAFEAGCDEGWAMQLNSHTSLSKVEPQRNDEGEWIEPKTYRERVPIAPDSFLVAQQLKQEEGYEKLVLRWEADPADTDYGNMAVWEDEEGSYIAVKEIDGSLFAVDTGFYFE